MTDAPLPTVSRRSYPTDGSTCPSARLAQLGDNVAAHMTAVRPETRQRPLRAPEDFLSLPLWTTEDTARYLRCEPQTILKNLSEKGSFHGLKPHRRFGRRWYFKAAEVRAVMEAA